MTADNAPAERRRIALVATVAVFVTLTVIAVAGAAILDDLRGHHRRPAYRRRPRRVC